MPRQPPKPIKRPRAPEQEFAEIIGMARIAPQAGLAQRAARRIVAEAAQLLVGDSLDGEAAQRDQQAERVQQIGKGARRAGGESDRRDQRQRSRGLDLQEQEQAAGKIRAPFARQRRIARIVARAGRAPGDMKGEAQGPERDEGGGEKATPGVRPDEGDRRGAGRRRPDGVDPAALAGPHSREPGEAHGQDKSGCA